MRKETTNKLHTPPQQKEAESAVLGLCLMGDREAIDIALAILITPECFYNDANKIIFSAIKHLSGINSPIDLTTVTSHLRSSNKLEEIGGVHYVTALCMGTTTAAYQEQYCMAIYEAYMQRELIRVCNDAISKVYAGEHDPFELIDQTGTSLNSILDKISIDEPEDVGSIYTEALMDIEEQRINGNALLGISSGYSELDRITLGWAKTDVIILAARPSQGKTALALNLAENAAKKGTPVLFFSLETPKKMLLKRMASSKTGVKFNSILTGNINESDRMALDAHISYFNSLPIKVDDKTRRLDDIKRKVRRWVKKNPDGLVIGDYLQLVSTSNKGNREQEVATISRDLKELAMELDVPIIFLAQLSRSVESTADKKPELFHLRESGAIEQDANIIMMIWWEKAADGSLNLWICVRKNKNGMCGDAKMKFAGDIQRWSEFDNVDYEKPGFVQSHINPPAQQQDLGWDNPHAGITPNYQQHFQQNTIPWTDDIN